MPDNTIEQVETFIQRLEGQLGNIQGAIEGHPNRLTSELLIFRQITFTAAGILRPDGRHTFPEDSEEVATLMTRARDQLAIARKCLTDGNYGRLYNELSILRQIATAAVGVMKNSPP